MNICAVRRHLLLSTAMVALATFGLNRQAFADQTLRFDIPAEPLSEALTDFARTSPQPIIYSESAVKGKKTAGLHGNYTNIQALEALTAGSDLTIQPNAAGVMMIRQKNVEAASNEEAAEYHNNSIEEVIVTTEKRSERLQDVPVPVTAVSGQAIIDRNQGRFEDYFSNFPSLNYGSGDRGEIFLDIRGVTTGPYTKPTVGIVFDDMPYGSSAIEMSAPDMDPSDVDHIEVLRGPQGTLYGASSLGGLVKYVTIDPSTESFSGRVEAGFSSVSNGAEMGYETRGAVNVPLDDTLAVRMSGFYRQAPGYINNPVTGANGVNEGHYYGGHFAMLWDAPGNFTVKLTALVQHMGQSGSDYAFTTPGFGDLQQNYPPHTQGFRRDDDVFGAVVKGKIWDIDVTSVTSYSYEMHADIESLGQVFQAYVQPLFGVPNSGYSEVLTNRKVSQELRLSSTVGNNLEWIAGAFFSRDATNSPFVFPAINPTTGSVAGIFGAGNIPVNYDEYALFANLTFHITDRLDVQVGGRQSFDHYSAAQQVTTGAYAADFFGSNPYFVNTPTESERPITYLFTPEFKMSPDLMVYARIATGFRPGGPNTAAAIAAGNPQGYAPDTTTNYEIGAKGNALDGMLSFDASLYHIKWNSIQMEVVNPTSYFGYTANVGSAKSEGIEISTELRPLDGLTISDWITLSDAALAKAVPVESGLYGKAGNILPYTSRFSANVEVQDEFAISDTWAGFVGGRLSYMGRREGDFQATPKRQIFAPYSEIDLRAGVTHDSWSVNMSVDNLADRRGQTGGGLDAYFPPFPLLYIRPRTISFSVSTKF